MELIISRHCVAQDSEGGLSPLQQALLAAPERVRIADAPTGAGKSYAFQYAMARQNARVLFIIPTRRLAQNLAVGLLHDLMEKEGWHEETARAKVAIWSSDETARLKEQGLVHVGGHRLRQLQSLDDTWEEGEIIFAIPEVVSHLLLRPSLQAGQAAKGIFDLLTHFEHIVFDEFHTIEPRGFGLAAVCAKLSAVFPWSRAKVSFLSATPLDICPVLDRLGVPAEQVKLLREEVGDKGRPLHGDVLLGFSGASSLAELIEIHKEQIAEEARNRCQTVVIYDQLGDLRRELPKLGRTLKSIGIEANRALVINSIDDSGRDGPTALGFTAGRWQDPDRFDVLIATASVEMGVTFRAANLMFMEPGFEPLNFLQRYGRAARRGEDGRVWVRCDESMRSDKPWLRELCSWVERHEGLRVSIENLTVQLSRSKQVQFRETGQDHARYFGALPNRAAFSAGLYWNALLAHPSNKGHRFEHLAKHQPQTAKAVYGWLKEVRKMQNDRFFGAAVKSWCDRFETLAYTLRSIGPRLRIVESDGRVIYPDLHWLRRETDIIQRFPRQSGGDGKEEIHLPGSLDDYLLEEKNRVIKPITVKFPHTQDSPMLPHNSESIDAWCRLLHDRRGRESLAWEDYPESMRAAEWLVRNTGLLVSDEESLCLAASNFVL